MLQSNWYVFGRLAWDHDLSAEEIAQEWVRMTLSNDAEVVKTVTDMMMASREITVNYMTPSACTILWTRATTTAPAPGSKTWGARTGPRSTTIAPIKKV
ncbi:MAG: hypothetical protein NVV73_02195 [Cellvibrionaceae bacterium]|nr:hypothetical protein [Cellvibrionaceae bacterium]